MGCLTRFARALGEEIWQLTVFNDSYMGDYLTKDEDIELPEDNKLLRSSGVRPQYLDNVRKRIHEVKFDINESYLNSTFKSWDTTK